MEIISGVERRRQWRAADKLRIVAEAAPHTREDKVLMALRAGMMGCLSARLCTGAGMDWDEVLGRLEGVVDLEETARATGALRRVRKVRRASDLLRLELFYGPGRLSLREAAAAAGDAGIATLSDKAVLGRLQRCGDWLELILARLLAQRRGAAGPVGEPHGLRLALVDGSVICGPGSQGPDWRVHARYDPAAGRFVDLAVSTGRVAEGLEHTALEAGTTLVVDRGYGRAEQIRAALAAGCGFVSRIGWRSLSLRPAETQGRFDAYSGASRHLIPI